MIHSYRGLKVFKIHQSLGQLSDTSRGRGATGSGGELTPTFSSTRSRCGVSPPLFVSYFDFDPHFSWPSAASGHEVVKHGCLKAKKKLKKTYRKYWRRTADIFKSKYVGAHNIRTSQHTNFKKLQPFWVYVAQNQAKFRNVFRHFGQRGPHEFMYHSYNQTFPYIVFYRTLNRRASLNSEKWKEK